MVLESGRVKGMRRDQINIRILEEFAHHHLYFLINIKKKTKKTNTYKKELIVLTIVYPRDDVVRVLDVSIVAQSTIQE
jgi:hypothetical protein